VATESAPPFLAAEYLLSVAALIARAPVIAVGRTSSGSAFLPLFRRGRDLVALHCERSPRFDLAGEAAALPTIWEQLLARRSWDWLLLKGVPVTSPLVRELPALARRSGCYVAIQPFRRSCVIPLRHVTDSFDRESSLYERREHHPRGPGDLRFERITEYDACALDDAFGLTSHPAARTGGAALASDPYVRNFYRNIARHFASRAQFSLGFLRVDGRRVAVHLAVEAGDTQHILEQGCDPASARWASRSLARFAALDAKARGMRHVEMFSEPGASVGGWPQMVLPQAEVRIYRSDLAGRLRRIVLEHLRPKLRAMLPTAARSVQVAAEAAYPRGW
jgi:hypothetical protein